MGEKRDEKKFICIEKSFKANNLEADCGDSYVCEFVKLEDQTDIIKRNISDGIKKGMEIMKEFGRDFWTFKVNF